MELDKRAINLWKKSEISYRNFENYISKKDDRFKLTIIDLFYVSNFKGGNATINEPENEIKRKLNSYEDILKEIDDKFHGKYLHHTSEAELDELIFHSMRAIELTDKKSHNKIDGFSVSFLTTLLHFYFPNLFPILDRRVLSGLGLLEKTDINSQKQVKNIGKFYPELISIFKNKTKQMSIRELDRELFVRTFQEFDQ